MTLQASGAISMNDCHVEIAAGNSGTLVSLNDVDMRILANITTPSSTISLNNFYGKSYRTEITLGVLIPGTNSSAYDDTAGWARRYGYSAASSSTYWHAEGTIDVSTGPMGSINRTDQISGGTLKCLQVVEYATDSIYGLLDAHLEIFTNRTTDGGWSTVTFTREGAPSTSYTFTRTNADHFGECVVVLDESGAAPEIPGLYRWMFSEDSVTTPILHSGNNPDVAGLHDMFKTAYANNQKIYAQWT